MTVAIIPSTGVMWSLPSRRGRSYSPDSAASAISAWSSAFETRPPALEVDVDHAERRRQRLRRLDLARAARSRTRRSTQVGVARRIDEDRGADPAEAGPCRDERSRSTRPSRTSTAWSIAWSRIRTPASVDQALPDDLEVLGEIGHPGAGAVRVGPLDDRARGRAGRPRRRRRCRRRPCAPASPACRSRRTCRGPRCSSRPGTAASRRAGPRRPPRAAAIAASSPPTRRRRRRHRRRRSARRRRARSPGSSSGAGPRRSDASETDHPPSTASDCPVTARDSSDRK